MEAVFAVDWKSLLVLLLLLSVIITNTTIIFLLFIFIIIISINITITIIIIIIINIIAVIITVTISIKSLSWSPPLISPTSSPSAKLSAITSYCLKAVTQETGNKIRRLTAKQPNHKTAN